MCILQSCWHDTIQLNANGLSQKCHWFCLKISSELAWLFTPNKMKILWYHEVFFRLSEPRYPSTAAGAVSLKKPHDIVILSFCQAKFEYYRTRTFKPHIGLKSIRSCNFLEFPWHHCTVCLSTTKPSNLSKNYKSSKYTNTIY